MSLPETQANLPTHRERQFMQHLRGAGWVKASSIPVPVGPAVIASLLKKGWIEQRGTGNEICYRITERA
jgi:hypothetical protein